jgi:putative flippase GtrA
MSQSIHTDMQAHIKKELAVFFAVGLTTIGVDFSLYQAILYFSPLGLDNVELAKGLSFISGTIFAYFSNRFWTFSHKQNRSGSIGRFILIYIFGLGSNILINYLSILLLGGLFYNSLHLTSLSFTLATIFSALINFIGMKFYVFPNDRVVMQSPKTYL